MSITFFYILLLVVQIIMLVIAIKNNTEDLLDVKYIQSLKEPELMELIEDKRIRDDLIKTYSKIYTIKFFF